MISIRHLNTFSRNSGRALSGVGNLGKAESLLAFEDLVHQSLQRLQLLIRDIKDTVEVSIPLGHASK